jgi:hypothetical protein
MINHKNNSDDFLKDFLQKADIESPSGDFTKLVMQKVNEPVQEPSLYQQIILKIKGWYFLAIIGGGALAYTMYYFINRDSKLLPRDFDPIVFPIFKRIFQSFSGLFQSMEISSFTVVIFLAIAGLFIIDRLISKLKTGRHIYFSF